MAFLDFIRNRQQVSQEQTTEPKPETAREMYAREATQEQASQRSVNELNQADKAEAKELGSRVDKAVEQIRSNDRPAAPSQSDSTANPEPMRQNMVNQDKEAPELSPTSAQRGTIARPTPSWER
ncbi:MAG TPA: hypothetical protein VMI06_01570 [Terriglobia bacterium]|nr:hypothetical protein [Terriglobia bacterium]